MREQRLEACFGGADFIRQLLIFILRRRELLAQLLVVGAQALAQRDELIYFVFERFELSVHSRTIGAKNLISQYLTLFFECDLLSRLHVTAARGLIFPDLPPILLRNIRTSLLLLRPWGE